MRNSGELKLSKYKFPFIMYKMVIKVFFSWFVISLGFFILIGIVLDIFVDLNRYLLAKAGFINILKVLGYYIPKCVSYALPVASLFAITYSIGNFYKNNELVAIFSSGISIFRLSIPIFIITFVLAISSLFFEDQVVIPTFRMKSDLRKRLLNSAGTLDSENLTIRGIDNDYIYNVKRFVAKKNELIEPVLLRIDSSYNILYRLDAHRARFDKDGWIFINGKERIWDEQKNLVDEIQFDKKKVILAERPKHFKRSAYKIEEMSIQDSLERIKMLKDIGLDNTIERTDYYRKYSFSFTIFVVSLLAISMGCFSKKNTLILSLFFSMGLAIVYYVIQMITVLMAKNGYVHPIVGAWTGSLLFVLIGIVIFSQAKT